MSNIKNKPNITDDYVVNVRRAAIEHRGKWAAAFYEEAKAEGIDLEPIMRRAIRKVGLKAGEKGEERFRRQGSQCGNLRKVFYRQGSVRYV